MTHSPIQDEAARLAANAWPIYQTLGWWWRGQPVTESRLALAIHGGIQQLADHPEQDSWNTGGLSLFWNDEEGDDRSISVQVTVDIGYVRPGDRASIATWPNSPAATTERTAP